MSRRTTNSSYQQQKGTLQHANKTTIDLPWNYKNQNKVIENIKPMDVEENKLSQKMSHLSTQIKTDNDSASALKDSQIDIEKIPDYLTKRNTSFQQILDQVSINIKLNDNDKIEDLRKISILIYKTKLIQTYQHLWIYYLKAGVGKLTIQSSKQTPLNYSTNISIWPKEIKTMVQATTMKITKENEHGCYFTFVQYTLQVLENQLKQYQSELNIKLNHFQNNSSTIEQQITTYIEQHFHSLQKEIEHRIELIHYDYHLRVLKLEYIRHQPNEYQKQLMNKLCQQKYEQETTEQEYNLLQKEIAYYNSSNQSFQSSSLAHSSLIESVQNPILRQQLFKELKDVAEESRENIFNLYLGTAQDEKIQCQNTYDTSIKNMWSDRNTSIAAEQIPSIMIDLINERCNKISERIQSIYRFKTQFIGSNYKL